MKKFILGVNYWASHAGVDMWRCWDEKTVKEDLELLRQNGVEVLRVFPNWRDFQPVGPEYTGRHRLREYRMSGDALPENAYFLDEIMLERFECLCRLAQEKGLKLIVALITGWMSGKLYLPSALYEKNIYTDAVALYFQQLFIKGFVTRFKKWDCIYAWDLGNECNCMDEAAGREEACSWSMTIVNGIRACDAGRPIISGMHSLEIDGVWNIQDQGEITDILTTHPYPFWVEHCQLTDLNHFRTLLHATAQTQYYATVGKKKCLVEEIGSMGPMICSEEKAADFLKVNLWSNWANGASGLLWWCAHEQSELTAPPYDWNMCERELGMTDRDKRPKPTLLAMKEFSRQMQKLALDLPFRESDGVCLLSRRQDHWGIAYMSYILGKQAGLTLDFAWCEQELPKSSVYFLPSVCRESMDKHSYDLLKKKVYEGATLYLSLNDAVLTEFEELTGFHVELTRKASKQGYIRWKNGNLPYKKTYQIDMSASRAEVLAEDESSAPAFGVADYGAGRVYLLNFPLEAMLLGQEDGFENPYYCFYQEAAGSVLKNRGVKKNNPWVGLTLHKGSDADYAVLVNYTGQKQEAGLEAGQYQKAETLHGDAENMEPFGATVVRLTSPEQCR